MSYSVHGKMNEELLARHNFAIIDPPLISGDSRNAWIDELPLKPIVPLDMRGDAGRMPRLLPLPPDAPYWQRVADNLSGQPDRRVLHCLIEAPGSSTGVIRAHVHNALLTHGHLSIYFIPFYDPRVFPHLRRIVRPQQLHPLFGPIRTMTFPFQDTWICHTPPEVPPGTLIPTLWQANAEQRQRMKRVQDLYEVLARYRREVMDFAPWPDYATYVEIMARIEQAMEYAMGRYGLTGPDDYREFAWHSIRYDEDFHLYHRVQELLATCPQEASGRRYGYADAVRNIEEEDWMAMATGR